MVGAGGGTSDGIEAGLLQDTIERSSNTKDRTVRERSTTTLRFPNPVPPMSRRRFCVQDIRGTPSAPTHG
jgi:hypothetical protein